MKATEAYLATLDRKTELDHKNYNEVKNQIKKTITEGNTEIEIPIRKNVIDWLKDDGYIVRYSFSSSDLVSLIKWLFNIEDRYHYYWISW